MAAMTYVETFDDGPGGWFRTVDNWQPPAALPIRDSAIWSQGPWWVDYNHAPPGGGYLQLLACLYTRGPLGETFREVGGHNRFIAGNYPSDFTDARVTVRMKGELELAGAQSCLLVQGRHEGTISGWVLTGQPITVTPEYSETTLRAVNDERQWTPLGSRHDRGETYKTHPLDTILRNVNVNIYFVFFPVTPRPMGAIAGDPHLLRAGRDYPVWPSSIVQGYTAIDRVQIDFK